jgi:hypothetical protein
MSIPASLALLSVVTLLIVWRIGHRKRRTAQRAAVAKGSSLAKRLRNIHEELARCPGSNASVARVRQAANSANDAYEFLLLSPKTDPSQPDLTTSGYASIAREYDRIGRLLDDIEAQLHGDPTIHLFANPVTPDRPQHMAINSTGNDD